MAASKDTGTQPKEATVAIRSLVFKASGEPLVSNAREVEDDYASYYTGPTHSLIEPPYSALQLEQLVERNNTLGPCIGAMVTNIDGTGYEIERRDGVKMEDADHEAVKPAVEFFDECCPMMSFQTLRQKTRREMEATGNGYVEVIRNPLDEVVFVGPLEAKMIRMARLGEAVPVTVTMNRKGKDQPITRLVRERKFAQKVAEKLVWFKEYGASRDLNKFTGEWAASGTRLPYELRATEILHFGVLPDINTPYYVPRWIGQTPSVISSRKAEENNVQFFETGGVPPYLVIVQGGQLAENTVQALRDALNNNDAQARVQVIEAFSTSGELGTNGNVQVKVEKFGGDRGSDPMFQNYDSKCEDKIRRSFRLPEILVGKTEQMNFATAHASYLVAEAQVFKPERDAFDEIISNTLLPELLGNRDYVYRSKPISIVDADTQLAVITKAMGTGRVDQEHAVGLLGEIGGIEFQMIDTKTLEDVSSEYATDPLGNVIPIASVRPQEPQTVPPKTGKGGNVAKKTESNDGLAHLIGCAMAVMAHQDVLSQTGD